MKALLLAGTAEAQAIAAALAGEGRVTLIASLAGVTRKPAPLACKTRRGGFGGAEGFRQYLAAESIDALIDATHPFAAQMSATAAEITAREGIPHLQVLRPEWTPGPGDNWTDLARSEDAADHIAPGQSVFLATGRQSLAGFANLARCRLICRQIDQGERPFPYPNGQFLIARPPFSQADEEALFRDLGIDWLIVKNSGGNASRAKLDAARALGLKVGMIRRPVQPDCARVASADEAVRWLLQQVAS